MKINDIIQFRNIVEDVLRCSIGDDYVSYVWTLFGGDIIEDVESCADEDYNEDDIRMAIGRVICRRLGIEV